MPRFVTCGPNEAIIVSGCCRSSPTIRAGGRVFIWPMFHRIQRLSLNTMTINVESPKVYSEGGVPVTVKGVAQVKIQGKDLSSLRSASEMFLDKTEEEIIEIAKATLDGHQRSMISSKKIEDIYSKRHEFSRSVQQSATTDFIDMGLTLVSYTVQEITDDEGYLDAVGQKNTVGVRSEARKEVAKAKKTSDSNNLDLDYLRQERQLSSEQTISLKRLEFEGNEARYLKIQYENQAKSEKAGDIQLAEMNKLIVKENLGVVLMEKERETDLILKKKELKQLELDHSIKRRADFECERQKALAEAHKINAKSEADQEASRLLKLAAVRADTIRLQKRAEAKVLEERALAFKQFGDAAKIEMVLAVLPRLTAEIAGPLTDCKKITSVSQDGSVGFSRITNEIMEVVERVCGSVSGLSGQSLASGNIVDSDDDDNNNNSNSNNNNNDETDNTDGTRPGTSKRKISTERSASSINAPPRTFGYYPGRFAK